jgi:lysozyme
MEISAKGLDLIKKFEGLELESYLCPADVWTIGYGSTKGVKEGMSITEEEAEALLKKEAQEYCDYVKEYVSVTLTQNQFDALVSWTYNLGPRNLKNSTLLEVLNKEEYDKVPEQILRWTKAAGKELNGLVRRRQAEADLFQSVA